MGLSPEFSLTWFFTGIILLISIFLLTGTTGKDRIKGIDPQKRLDRSTNLDRPNFTDREEKIYRQAYSRGRKIGYSMGRHQNSLEQAENFNSTSETIETAKNQELDGYSFFFGDIRGAYSGLSWPGNDTVKLELSELETAGEVETMCDHEIAHQLFPDFRHPVQTSKMLNDTIYKYSDDMHIRICDRLAGNLTR